MHGKGNELPAADAALTLSDSLKPENGRIPERFVGISTEWCLIERYMQPSARPAFANLLKNLGTGVLRIGGSAMDLMEFRPNDPNRIDIITPEDLSYLRATMDTLNAGYDGQGAPNFGLVLGTAMTPMPNVLRPWVGVEHARTFLLGVESAFPSYDPSRKYIFGIEPGNEPDLSYKGVTFVPRFPISRYVDDFTNYATQLGYLGFRFTGPGTSEPIFAWHEILSGAKAPRYYLDWPMLTATFAPLILSHAPAAVEPFFTDHYYPMARVCTPADTYRCPLMSTLMNEDRMDNFRYQTWFHADESRKNGLGYRLAEINTAAGRGANGLSNVAGSAIWGLDTMFNAACPQPPHDRSINSDCKLGAVGVNFHNAEVRAFFFPEEGNGYYNAINYDPSPAVGSPSAQPLYYAMLMFSHYAQGSSGLRRVAVTTADSSKNVAAWQVDGATEKDGRLFLLNKSLSGAVTVNISVRDSSHYAISRMSPVDPSGTGKTLTASQVSIDGRRVNPDGTWPGFAPERVKADHQNLRVTLGHGEAVVIFRDNTPL